MSLTKTDWRVLSDSLPADGNKHSVDAEDDNWAKDEASHSGSGLPLAGSYLESTNKNIEESENIPIQVEQFFR